MNFLNPAVLFGLFAASIPILLHLLNLRKLKTVEFSSLRFLKELQKTKIRRLKMKQILLLILRTLIIIFAVLAFARPTIKSSLPFLENYANSSCVILIDNSFSMDVSDEYGNRLKQAKKAASDIIKSLKEGDEVAIIELASPLDRSKYAMSRNFNLLDNQIQNIKVSYTRAALDRGLKLAATLLDESVNLNKEIFVISDAQSNVFERRSSDTSRIFNSSAGIYFIPIGSSTKSNIRNLSIDSINVVTRVFEKQKPVEVEITVRNSSSDESRGSVANMSFNGQNVAQRQFDVAANSSRTVAIAAPSSISGAVCGAVTLENDALDADNKAFFGFIIPDKPRIAVIGGRGGTEYLSLALNTLNRSGSFADISFFAPNQLSGIELSNYEAIILADGPFSNQDLGRLKQYIQAGGAALLFPDASPGMAGNYSILELNIAGKKDFAKKSPASFSSIDRSHPLFQGVFKGSTDSRQVVESPFIYTAYPELGGQRIIDMPGGSFLSEKRLGTGRLIYCAVRPDIESGNFPVTGIFPTILYRSIVYLSASESLAGSIETGKPVSITIPKRFAAEQNLTIVDPYGNKFFQQPVALPGGSILTIDPVSLPGVYSIYSSSGKCISLVASNLPPDESRLIPLEKKSVSSQIQSEYKNKQDIRFIDDLADVSQNIIRARLGTELWQLFIILALACAIAEMIVQKVSKKEAD